MSEKDKPWCFKKMDLLVTEPCTKCRYFDECWELSFGGTTDDIET